MAASLPDVKADIHISITIVILLDSMIMLWCVAMVGSLLCVIMNLEMLATAEWLEDVCHVVVTEPPLQQHLQKRVLCQLLLTNKMMGLPAKCLF